MSPRKVQLGADARSRASAAWRYRDSNEVDELRTTYEIFPAIGIARVGSSRMVGEDGYFIGPEPGTPPPQKYRDTAGNLKRQAARFRVFRCRRDECGKRLEAEEVRLEQIKTLTWTVHLANRKGVARRGRGFRPGNRIRNLATQNDELDRDLIIDPGSRSVSQPGDRGMFDTGRFRTTVVPLGEIFMDAEGRLVVLGGYGRAGSDPAQERLTVENGHYADNDNWYDDTSDGPVSVRVELADGTVCESWAWVIVAPPDFAPGITNIVTLYDVLMDLAVKRGVIESPAKTPNPLSFTQHVKPILERAIGYRWVNRYARYGYEGDVNGHGFGHDSNEPGFWAKYADPSDASRGIREAIARRLRNPNPAENQTRIPPYELMPRIANGISSRMAIGNVLALTQTQYTIMCRWAAGDFFDDSGHSSPRLSLPETLDRTALEGCVGGPLDPGIEASGEVLLDPSRYIDAEPFRLSHVKVRAGEVTGANAVPWQADHLACQWEDGDYVTKKLLAWWPAQRPDDVITASGDQAMVPWTRGLGEDYQDMIDKWDRLGLVVDKGEPNAPFFVENERDERGLEA